MESYRTFRVNFFDKSGFTSSGWVFGYSHEFVAISFKQLYKYLLHLCKDYFDCNLRDIIVTENCIPLIAFHIRDGIIFVENLKTRKCLSYDKWNVL